MLVKQIFELAVNMAKSVDPRGAQGIKEYLADVKKEHDKSSSEAKSYFNAERLDHPYSDSGVHFSDDKTVVKRVLAGIDIDGSEILLASQLSERGKKIDLVMGHHPLGRGLADLHGVMDMQVAMFEQAGVPVHVAEKMMEERIKEVGRSIHPINHYQIIDMARLLKVNLMNTHTPTDNLVNNFLMKFLSKKKLRTVGDFLDALLEIPEYQEAKRRGAGPNLLSGNPKSRLGKFILEMTGGTNPSDAMYEALSRYGISTIVGMHMKESARGKANEHHLNIVIAGHMASDSLGMNLLLDELEKKGIDVVPCGGLIRVSRVGKKK
ncbi:MAG: NIF3 (NGG1p interacting factor 3)-like protein [Candidatus Magasanikbacteria bacterium GW2011_GWC2_34_16]|uniref:NIF3 (NGG1p interacting factor 3)-like protein n=2 Tax=Candidatus Magasanikiibacteriota TaxID=1752731 RepID=A0A0G0JW82_9BACT|nr:MAG: NIF3 (NGG1p interacting factor 3)-like protein [Candidatus Magasanikbacteria bacterium GW2011_GWC2_34_16]KKQ41099.1 MAG: NIF3 (NGG1p interacting factor 3)-like protein [Candidatus Magasanikbacteria bacterium GW2011_GWA2_37_8]